MEVTWSLSGVPMNWLGLLISFDLILENATSWNDSPPSLMNFLM